MSCRRENLRSRLAGYGCEGEGQGRGEMNAGTMLLLMQGMYWDWWFDAWQLASKQRQGVVTGKTAEYLHSE
jgi:hypothetical protein